MQSAAPFALAFAQPREPEHATPYSYSAKHQINLCADGSRAADNHPMLMATSGTTSTAGSKTHADDD
ncbi:hypothetical protein AB0E08_08290 [Streptomyces sp. NPDC048281]|uniref:hypothetical protein n=1 Tax=Streptomyces sp. NPDC048281 TaxID=3154715 RepID=UPI003437FDC8